MKPSPELVLNHAFAKIAMEMGPALPPGYGQGSATTTGVLLLMVAQEFNRAAAIRHAENDDMRSLFAQVSGRIPGALSDTLRVAAGGQDKDLTVSALDATNAVLKKVLVELHSAAEARGDRDLDHQIVRLMQGWAVKRQVLLPAM
jgi:hypothetical protein